MLVVIRLLHLAQGSQDTILQHVVLAKPHSLKSIREAIVNLILKGTHWAPRIDISICISQPYPKVISTGVIIQFQEHDLLIQMVMEGSLLLPVLSFPSSAGFRGAHQSHRGRVQLAVLWVIPQLVSILSPWEIPHLPLRKLLTWGEVILVWGDSSWDLVMMFTTGARQLVLPPLLKLSWGVV